MTIDEFNIKVQQITTDYLESVLTVLAKFESDLDQLANDAKAAGLDAEITTALFQIQLRRIELAGLME